MSTLQLRSLCPPEEKSVKIKPPVFEKNQFYRALSVLDICQTNRESEDNLVSSLIEISRESERAKQIAANLKKQ